MSAPTIADRLRALADEVALLELVTQPQPPVEPEPEPEPEPQPEPTPEPQPEPTPEPVLTPESYRIWSNYMLKTGPSASEYNRGLDLRWRRANGDWLDRDGIAYGATPWHLAQIELSCSVVFVLL